MIRISDIIPGSIAERFNLQKGDKIVQINNKEIKDFIDFEYETADNYFELTVEKKDTNSLIKLKVNRGYGEELGIVLNEIIYDKLKYCNNNCIFCFVDQQPPGLRNSLYIKDDDYRFSFLQGSYITLTNLNKSDFARIIKYRLSPLYISVHTTNPALRQKMMRNTGAAKIREQLTFLADNGIKFNTQVVLCPGINDGVELDRTIKDLLNLYPAVNSLGVVPVGLTKYRKNLSNIKPYNKEKAISLLKQIERWQEIIREKCTYNWLYAADEFYLLADKNIPELKYYHDFPQLENGIGLTRKLWENFAKINLPREIGDKKIAMITAELGKKSILPLVNKLNLIKGLDLEIITVKNNFFGRSVTVTGLLTASDIRDVLIDYNVTNTIIIPNIVLNEKGYFLDDKTPDWLQKELSSKKLIFCTDFADIMEVIDYE